MCPHPSPHLAIVAGGVLGAALAVADRNELRVEAGAQHRAKHFDVPCVAIIRRECRIHVPPEPPLRPAGFRVSKPKP